MLNFTHFLQRKLKKKSKLVLYMRLLFILLTIIIFSIYSLLTTTKHEAKFNQLNENSFLNRRLKREISSTDSSINCTKPSILAFPSDGLTQAQRRSGWIIVHLVVMFYGFWFLASVCDDYLVPSIKQICSNYHIDHDVIGATIMAAAVASPELFMNFIGTFITKGDIGVGTIVGSAVFNVLAVPACCGLFIHNYFKLNWWPITRDCLMYLVAVLALIGILRDAQVWWYEALGLIIVYFGYMLVMYYNKKIFRCAKRLLRRIGLLTPAPYKEVTEFTHLLARNNNQSNLSLAKEAYHTFNPVIQTSHIMLHLEQQESEEKIASPWSREKQMLIEFILRWPITFLLWLTVPNCRQHHSCKYVTFLLSIVWLAAISYMMAFVITIIGDTLFIPDAVMGLNVLAAGMSIPEAVSSIIVTKQGEGCMGLSNSLGSNTFDILLSLGLPWFIKSFFLPDNPEQKLLTLNSASLTYAGILLLTSLLGLYLVFVLHKFTLNWRVGVSCLIMYLSFMTIATLIELNVFFPVNLPSCSY